VPACIRRRDDDAEPRAGVDVDVREDAALADESQRREPLEQRCPNRRALADQHERLAVAQPLRERLELLHVVVVDRDVVGRQLREARERPEGVEVVVEDGDLHR
jgi:hypothetical protein